MYKKFKRKGLMLVLSSPSGAGKTTISRKLLERDESLFMSVSATTRKIRQGEQDGKDYYFTEMDKFKDMLVKGEFLEYAEVFGNMYGTPRKPVYDQLSAGRDVLFDIDWQGTKSLKEKCHDDVVSIFILPPTMAELERRLRMRAQDDEEIIRYRMSKASHEISHWQIYDYVFVNEDIDETVKWVEQVLFTERLRRERIEGLESFVKGLVG